MQPWWEKYPGLLDAEYDRLKEIGAQFEEREDEKAAGSLVLDIAYPTGGQSLRLEARFPDTYPYTRPEVYAPDLRLQHHQNPFERNLCVIGRRSENWTPQMSLADLIKDQIPKVTAANEGVDLGPDVEERQGEPVTTFFQFQPDSLVFIDGAWRRPLEATAGDATIAVVRKGDLLRAQVASLRAGNEVFSVPEARALLQDAKIHPARWVHLSEPILERDAATFDRVLRERVPALNAKRFPYGLDLILVGFPEEHGHRQKGQGWILLVREKVQAKGSINRDRFRLLPVHRIGRSDFAVRVPVFESLQEKEVTVFGLGCVGAPIAIELAKGGIGNLFGVDHDTVDGASTARWPLGIAAAGRFKLAAIGDFIGSHYPYTSFDGVAYRVGSIPQPGDKIRDSKILPEIFSNSDLVIDATAELGIQRLLSDFALEYDIPYVVAHSTNGGYGGQLVRLKKGTTGCLNCLRWHQVEGTIDEPPFLAGDWSQPAGCAAPTFVGSSWDLQEVSLAAVRIATTTLLGGDQPWDVAILRLVDHEGRPCPPHWTTFSLPIHAKCSPCLAK